MAAKKKTTGSTPRDRTGPEAPGIERAGSSEPTAQATGTPKRGATAPLCPVVGIGASAGGLEALTEFFRALSAGSGLAFVVVSHLDPEHKSALGEILSRVSRLPVREIEDGMAVEPDHVYVMPPNRDLTLVQGVLHLAPRAETRGLHMPIDTFLRSLSADRRTHAIGVILSGTGSDGTLGLKAIKEEGGLAFAQDQSARYSGMPDSAVAAGCVDAILPPARIAAEMLEITRHPLLARAEEAEAPVAPGDVDAFLQILRLLSDTTGVDFVHYKHSTLRRRLERRLVLRRLPTLADYLRCVRDDRCERETLFEEFLIPVTNFFRDPEVFEALKTTAFPSLMAGRAATAPIRVWVPGCASGEEAYSIAICLLEYLGSAASAVPIHIFATDISERAVETARVGVYGEGIAAEVSTQRLQRFFQRSERGYQITPALRDLCVFARQDVTRDPPFSHLDLISCRNVLIYLGSVLQNLVLPIFHYALKPGGYLVLGTSETVSSFTQLFEPADKKHKFYVRTATQSRLTFDYTPGTPPQTRIKVQEGATEPVRGLQNVYRDADRVVLAQYAPSGVVVDENLQIVQFRGDTGHYLKPVSGPPTADLLLMAREGLLGDLRATLESAKKGNAPARKEGVRVRSNDHFRKIDLEVIPITDLASGARHFVVLFAEARSAAGAEAAVPKVRLPATAEEESAKDQEIGRLKHELETTRAYLQSVIEQKDVSNEELLAANEEIVSANEELQSTNEELTTAKEELQATNEELTTVNEELRNRIRLANQLGDDLVNLIESTNIPIMVLGTDLGIRRFTPGAERVLNVRAADVGRPIGDLKLKVNVPDLETLVQEVIDTLEVRQREVTDEAGAWHKLYIRPYKSREHGIGGVVVMLVDIDVIKQAEAEVRRLAAIVESSDDAIIGRTLDATIVSWNAAAERMYGYSAQEAVGQSIFMLVPPDRVGEPRQVYERIRQGEHFPSFRTRRVRKDGGEIVVAETHSPIKDEAGRIVGISGIGRDITEQERMETALQASEAKLRAVVNTAVDAIVTIDERGIINSVNPATEKTFGYSAAEMLGQNVKMLMPFPFREEHDGYLAHYLQTGEKHIIGIGREVQGRRKDGSTFPLDLAVSESVSKHGTCSPGCFATSAPANSWSGRCWKP